MCRLLCLLLPLLPIFRVCGEDPQAPSLSDDQRKAVETVTEGKVLATVSFLASDELAGRDTPSAELRIASAYVAARFRGAGLKPLGENDSYFQNHVFPLTKSPRTASVTVAGKPVNVLGVLLGASDDTDCTAVCQSSEADDAAASEVVLLKDFRPPAVRNRWQSLNSVARITQRFRDTPVKVVLIAAESSSPLVQMAAQLSSDATPIGDTALPDCCVVLIDKSSLELEGQEVTVACPAQSRTDESVRNVVGMIPGDDDMIGKEAVLITAHLDHIGRSDRGDDRINNGADDNASGVTGVLTLADAFSALNVKPRRSLIFATFWGEEKGLRGSKEMAARPPWPLNRIVANVNLEMIGRPEKDAQGKAWMTGWQHSNLGDIMNAGSKRVGVEIFDRKDVGEMLYRRSDNYSFVKVGVVAHSFSAGSLHSDYHQPTDEWEKLDMPHMTKVIKGLFAGILNVANSDAAVESRSAP